MIPFRMICPASGVTGGSALAIVRPETRRGLPSLRLSPVLDLEGAPRPTGTTGRCPRGSRPDPYHCSGSTTLFAFGSWKQCFDAFDQRSYPFRFGNEEVDECEFLTAPADICTRKNYFHLRPSSSAKRRQFGSIDSPNLAILQNGQIHSFRFEHSGRSYWRRTSKNFIASTLQYY